MATYYNMASLSGLAVGDVVEYNTNTAIDFTGIKTSHIELYGLTPAKAYGGGKTTFDLDTSIYKPFYYSSNGGYSLCYGNTYDAYYRIAVAGNAGQGGEWYAYEDTSYYGYGGAGGGLTASGGCMSTSDPNTPSSSKYQDTYAGSQTSGGVFPNYSAQNGSFGTGGTGFTTDSRGTNSSGGNGWYGGAGARGRYQSAPGASGGSGFAIGQSTIVYPNGYMGGDSALIAGLEGAVSNATLVKGGAISRYNTSLYGAINGKMVITILELEPTVSPTCSYFDGTNFVPCEMYYCIPCIPFSSTISVEGTTGDMRVSYDSTLTEFRIFMPDNRRGTSTIRITGSFEAGKEYNIGTLDDGDGYMSLPTVSNGSISSSVENQFLSYLSGEYSGTSKIYNKGLKIIPSSNTSYIDIVFSDSTSEDDDIDYYIDNHVYLVTGSTFIKVQPMYYNGSEFVECGT